MPPKVRELISELEQAGFHDRGGKGSHRNFVHPRINTPITISGQPGEDAKPYQIKAVRRAIDEADGKALPPATAGQGLAAAMCANA
jgi:predicted RNA binding protein YcfA (HicA-like mRNA interferase family)